MWKLRAQKHAKYELMICEQNITPYCTRLLFFHKSQPGIRSPSASSRLNGFISSELDRVNTADVVMQHRCWHIWQHRQCSDRLDAWHGTAHNYGWESACMSSGTKLHDAIWVPPVAGDLDRSSSSFYCIYVCIFYMILYSCRTKKTMHFFCDKFS